MGWVYESGELRREAITSVLVVGCGLQAARTSSASAALTYTHRLKNRQFSTTYNASLSVTFLGIFHRYE